MQNMEIGSAKGSKGVADTHGHGAELAPEDRRLPVRQSYRQPIGSDPSADQVGTGKGNADTGPDMKTATQRDWQVSLVAEFEK